MIVPIVLEFCEPKSVLDVGCGTGQLLAEFKRSGVTDVLGVEGPWVPRSSLTIEDRELRIHDLTTPLSLNRHYDLTVCTEVAEHLPETSASVLVDSLTTHSDLVLFSAAIPFQGGIHHVNEQWPAYWAHQFARHDYVPVDCLRRRIWTIRRIPYFYKQNLLFYVRRQSLDRNERLRREFQTAPGGPPLPLVHPDRFHEGYVSWRGLAYSTKLALINLLGLRRSTAEGYDRLAQPAKDATDRK